MQIITSIIEPFMLDRLTRSLRKNGVPAYTVTEIKTYDVNADNTDEILNPKVKLEVVVEDDKVLSMIDFIREEVSSHQESDGIILVSELKHVVAIKSGKTGMAALARKD